VRHPSLVPVVTLRFRPLPEHVRTARLVAVAVARRAGAGEDDLEEIRLAVGEICARAVRRCAHDGVGAPVVVQMDDSEQGLRIVVMDEAGPAKLEDEDVALALVEGLADAVDVTDGPGGAGGNLRAQWTWRSATSHGSVYGPRGDLP